MAKSFVNFFFLISGGATAEEGIIIRIMSWFLMNKKGEERKRKEEIKKQFLKVKYCCLKEHLLYFIEYVNLLPKRHTLLSSFISVTPIKALT
jgi:hypothetical protein